MGWKDKLTKGERKHLRETGVFSLKQFKDLRWGQIAMMEKIAGNHDIPAEIAHGCLECRRIAAILGI